MQPLISPVDHESRHNSHLAEEIEDPMVSEDTPLLQRFPSPNTLHRSPVTIVTVTLLLIILVSGVLIGIYLLILQSDSENVLPPVDMPLQLVSRAQWDRAGRPPLGVPLGRASQVILVHTGTEECHSTSTCSNLLQDIQNKTLEGQTALPYNFLISSNGQTYEALGWRQTSPLFPQYPTSLVFAFIGNFTRSPPTHAQIVEANNLIAESVSRQYLEPSYTVIGKSTKDNPTYLFDAMSSLPQWNKEMSDS